MIVKTNNIPKGYDALTVYPYIFIRPEWADNEALIAHEMVHYDEQSKGKLKWWFKYTTSKEFRLDAEVRAYKRQLEFEPHNINIFAKLLMTYGVDISYEKAITLLH